MTELLLHPVRLRIVHAMYDGGTLTTSDLCALLPDVSKATVYRHVALLAEGGLLEVESEHRVQGAVERRYRLHKDRAVIDTDTAAAMSLDEHRRGFTAATAALLAEFGSYLDRGEPDLIADLVAYRQMSLWLSRDELIEVMEGLRDVIAKHVGNAPSQDRKRHLLSAIVFPASS